MTGSDGATNRTSSAGETMDDQAGGLDQNRPEPERLESATDTTSRHLPTWIWDQICRTPKEVTKEFRRRGGFSGTDINPQYRVQRLTELFGPCGIGWGYTIHDRWLEKVAGVEVAYVDLSIWYMVNGKQFDTPRQIGGTVADRTPDEVYKMSITDAVGKCAALLGLGADVYLGQFDSKYQAPQSQPAASTPPPDEKPEEYWATVLERAKARIVEILGIPAEHERIAAVGELRKKALGMSPPLKWAQAINDECNKVVEDNTPF